MSSRCPVLFIFTFPHLTVLYFPVPLFFLSGLDDRSLGGIINPFPWLLYILNQSHSVFSAPAFNPLSQLEKNRTTKFIGATKSSWFQPQSGPQWHLWGTPFMNPEFNPSLIPYNKHFRIFYEIKYSILWLYHSQWCTISATLQWCLCCQIRIIAVIFLVS